MKKDIKLFLVKDNFVNHGDLLPGEQKSSPNTVNASENEAPEKAQRRPSRSLEEIMKQHPGKFTNGQAKPESERISAFILPGGRPGNNLQKTPATPEMWEEHQRIDKGLEESLRKYNPPTEVPVKSQERTSLPFAEISKLHPGRFIDGNAELMEKGITAFIIPGMGIKPEPMEVSMENEATAEDWKMFEDGEKSLDAMMKRHEAIRKK